MEVTDTGKILSNTLGYYDKAITGIRDLQDSFKEKVPTPVISWRVFLYFCKKEEFIYGHVREH